MPSNIRSLKIQIPALPPVPPNAERIGELAADMLALAQAAFTSVGRVLSALSPREVRAELDRTATGVQAERPAAAVTLRSVAAKGWIY